MRTHVEWTPRSEDSFQAMIGKEYVGSVHLSKITHSWISHAMGKMVGFFPSKTEAQAAVEERFVK